MNIDEIKNLLATQSAGDVIDVLQRGRQTDVPEWDRLRQDLNPETHKIMSQAERPDKWVAVDNKRNQNENGKQLNIAGTDGKTYRIEFVTRIALALQRLIVKRAVVFSFGTPVNYLCTPANDAEDALLQDIKRVFLDNKIESFDRKLARTVFTETECAEIWYTVPRKNNRYGFPSDDQIRCQLVSPSDGSTLYPYFDEYGDLIAFSRMYQTVDLYKQTHTFFETFTDDAHYLWEQNEGTTWVDVEGYPQANPLGKIPVVYSCQPAPEWAEVQGLIERLEKLLSNFGDTNDYHASPKIFVKGNIKGWAKKGESGQIIQGDENASAQYLSWAQAPDAVKLEIETLLRMIYTLTQTPDISFDAMKSIGQVSGTALRLLFMDPHLKVLDKQEIFIPHLQRRASVVKSMLAGLNPVHVAPAETIAIYPQITPYMMNDDSTRISQLMQATGNKAIMSRETAITELGYVDDINGELEKIQAEETAGMSLFDPEPTE